MNSMFTTRIGWPRDSKTNPTDPQIGLALRTLDEILVYMKKTIVVNTLLALPPRAFQALVLFLFSIAP
jgi:hypothetical protein